VISITTCLIGRSGRPYTIRYDTIQEFNVDSKAECDRLNLAHIGRKNIYQKTRKLKQNKRQWPLISVQVQDP